MPAAAAPIPLAPLHAEGLTLRYPRVDQPALVDVDVVVQPGECVALLGPNGAGKTTLVSCATGLLRPDAGRIRVAGGDPLDAGTRLDLGVALQDTAFPRHLTVGELVHGAAVRCGAPRTAVAAVIEELGLAPLSDRRSRTLSGGQARRVQLARALVGDPALLVLDEPTTGLDADARQAFWVDLARRRDRGLAVLLTTHAIDEAGAVADRVVVLVDGRVVADATPAALTEQLPDRTVAATTAVAEDHVRALDGVLAVEAAPAGAGRHHLRIATAVPESVVRHLLAADPGLTGLRVEGAGLEEAVAALGRRMPDRSAPDRSAPADHRAA